MINSPVPPKDNGSHTSAVSSSVSRSASNHWYPWIDSMKGIGILFVVMGHTCTYAPLFRWIYSFHMALFFIISGLLFHPKPFVQTVKRKAFRLLVPYAFFATITFLYWALIERRLRHGNQSVLNAFCNLFIARAGSDNYPQNAVLWFLPCLFITEILFSALYQGIRFLARNAKNSTIIQRLVFVIVVAVCLVLGYTLGLCVTSRGIRLPWALDIVPFSLTFVIIGYLAQPLLESCNNIWRYSKNAARLGLAILGLVGFTALWIFDWITGLIVNFNDASVSNPAEMLVASLIGFVAVAVLCIGIDNPALRYLGSASLTIMCVHEPIKRIIVELMGRVLGIETSTLRSNLLMCLLIVAVTVIICLVGHALLDRFAPILIGKRTSHRKTVIARHRR